MTFDPGASVSLDLGCTLAYLALPGAGAGGGGGGGLAQPRRGLPKDLLLQEGPAPLKAGRTPTRHKGMTVNVPIVFLKCAFLNLL